MDKQSDYNTVTRFTRDILPSIAPVARLTSRRTRRGDGALETNCAPSTHRLVRCGSRSHATSSPRDPAPAPSLFCIPSTEVRCPDHLAPPHAGASTALGDDIIGGFGNRHRASEVDIPDAPETWAQCPDYECTPCKSKSSRNEACPHGNFTGIGDIICGYKDELCEQLRLQHRACRKARGRMCKPVGVRTRTVCTIARTIITEDAWRRRRAIERFESLTWTCARGTGRRRASVARTDAGMDAKMRTRARREGREGRTWRRSRDTTDRCGRARGRIQSLGPCWRARLSIITS